MINYEGFYLFGGLLENENPTNQLLILKPRMDKIRGRAKFHILAPETIGQAPEARYQHAMAYIPNLSLVVIHGGRNDKRKIPIFDDLWLIKLHNLEYVRVQIGGARYMTPRCNHCAFINES